MFIKRRKTEVRSMFDVNCSMLDVNCSMLDVRRVRAAFSLLEIIVVLALMATVTGVAVMSIASITGAQDKPIERVFREFVREARILAATTKNVVYLSFDGKRGEFVLAERNGDALDHFLVEEDDIEPSEWEIQFFPKLAAERSFGVSSSVGDYARKPVPYLVFHPSGIATGAKIIFTEQEGYTATLTLDPFSSGPAPGSDTDNHTF